MRPILTFTMASVAGLLALALAIPLLATAGPAPGALESASVSAAPVQGIGTAPLLAGATIAGVASIVLAFSGRRK